MKKEGYVFAPYIMSEFVSIDTAYDNFMDKYNMNHKYCPKCGSVEYLTTFMAYTVDMNNLDKYKDLNKCTCSVCNDKHVMHDRISLSELRMKKLNKIL